MIQTQNCFYLVHTNDTHSHIDGAMLPLSVEMQEHPASFRLQCGGFARLASFLRQSRQQASSEQLPLLYLDAGDSFQGTMFYTCFKGEANVRLLNRLGLDAMTVGNHELDTGNKPLYHFLQQSEFPLLAGNWDLSGEAENKLTRMQNHPRMISWENPAHPKPYIVKMIGDTPVAIFGLVLENMAEIAAPDADSRFLPVLSTARKILDQIQEDGIQHIILLSHLGYARDCQLAAELPQISMIIGGHTHTLQGDFASLGLKSEGDYGHRIGQTVVLQAGYNSLMVGRAKVQLLPEGRMQVVTGKNQILTSEDANLLSELGEPLPVRIAAQIRACLRSHPLVSLVIPDSEIDQLIEKNYRQQLLHYANDRVASLPKGLRHVRIPDELGGSQIAPLVAESMLYQAQEQGVAVDVALFNAGGARISLPPGMVTAAELAGRLLPFSSTISYFSIEGEQLRLALEGAIINALECGGTGSFPYPANLRYHYQAAAPKGQRVNQVWIKDHRQHWQPLGRHQAYSVITTSYTAMGKEGYSALQQALTAPKLLGPIISEAFINFARHKQTLLPPSEPLYQLDLLHSRQAS